METESFDVIIVGAGISGINCAYRLQTELPRVKFAILEGRDRIGGTWDLHKFPGLRCDSDINCLGFEWHRWTFDHPIASGSEILEYLSDAVSTHHLDRYIRFRHKVLSTNWSTPGQHWNVVAVDHNEKHKRFRARWIVLGTGYYDYDTSPRPDIPGLDNFKGKIIHPQFWPQGFDYANKKIAVVGSGATAISLLPVLAKTAAQVTIVQRSPTYITTVPNTSWLHDYLPRPLVRAWRRMWSLWIPYFVVLLCQNVPGFMREGLRKKTAQFLPKGIDVETHFSPRYNPWEQRLCLDPDAAFLKSLHRPNVHLITDKIETVTSNGIKMRDGQVVDADILVTATGFRMLLGGKIDIKVDDQPISWGRRFVWNGSMLDAVPNLMFMFGYTNHAWTLGADDTAIVLTRLWKYMERNSAKSAVPRVSEKATVGTHRLWQLSSTYVAEAEERLPVYGVEGNWRPRIRPPIDYIHARWGDYTSGLEFAT
ncbi:putative flavin-binding monooxygenase [Hypomontagnella monticulosa]|nr:putative flavin-binding monooxygenase [Hypomontagnella monticulosa]